MRKICFFSGDISRSGGTERVTTVIANALINMGFDVSILSLSNGTNSYFPIDESVQLYSLRMEGYSANFSDLIVWWRLHKFIKNKAIDYIIDVDILLSWYSVLASIFTHTKTISWEHFNRNINVGDVFQRFRRLVGRYLAMRFANLIIVLTQRDRQQYTRNPFCQVPVATIPNPKSFAYRQRSQMQKNTVLSAGRLVPEKGFDMLLRSWSKLNPNELGWILRIVGSGPEDIMLRALAESLDINSSVEFVPHTNDMESIYKEASIFVCSSRFEGFPLVVLEARSLGLPVVSFDCGGPSEIIRHGIDGLIVEKENIDELAVAILDLISNESKRNAFGVFGYEDNRFNIEKIIEIWRNLLV